jgi:L-alanine-DL-glutamate epimerase-like enolase superfamily enzyme
MGENVAFYEADHERFAAHIEAWFTSLAPATPLRVGTALGAAGTLYERAALEAALIDLGLRQARLSLLDLTGVSEASLRFVVSLAADPNLRAAIARLRHEGYQGELKIDVDPSWSPEVFGALARDSSIAIFDFKGRGDAALARRLYEEAPSALFEDPPAGFVEPHGQQRSRTSRDQAIPSPDAVAEARARGEAVNLKAPRMGGPLAVLRGLERALTDDPTLPAVTAYLGGMFEVGVGRLQARQLAALYCASAPNDLALNSASRPRLSSPAQVRFDQHGFGGG